VKGKKPKCFQKFQIKNLIIFWDVGVREVAIADAAAALPPCARAGSSTRCASAASCRAAPRSPRSTTEVHQDEERARSITPAFPRTPLQSADGVLGHGEQVWEVPEGAEVLASSDKTAVEMFRVGEHVLGIQGHPEYTKDILLSLVDRLLAAGSITVSAIRLQTPLPLLDL